LKVVDLEGMATFLAVAASKSMVVAADQLQGRLFVAKQMMVILIADPGINYRAEATEFMPSLQAVIGDPDSDLLVIVCHDSI
jgi:hypothetical protein